MPGNEQKLLLVVGLPVKPAILLSLKYKITNERE